MGYGTNLLDGNGHDAPPVVAGFNRIIAPSGLIP